MPTTTGGTSTRGAEWTPTCLVMGSWPTGHGRTRIEQEAAALWAQMPAGVRGACEDPWCPSLWESRIVKIRLKDPGSIARTQREAKEGLRRLGTTIHGNAAWLGIERSPAQGRMRREMAKLWAAVVAEAIK